MDADTDVFVAAASFLVDTRCRRPESLSQACRQFADDPEVAGAVVGILGLFVAWEAAPAGYQPEPGGLVELRVTDLEGAPKDVDDLEPDTRACARIVACLVGGDQDTARAIVSSFAYDRRRGAQLLERMTTYAHAAMHAPELQAVTMEVRADDADGAPGTQS